MGKTVDVFRAPHANKGGNEDQMHTIVWNFVHGRKNLKYELKGKDEAKMLRHLAAEGITEANGWRQV